VRANVSRGWRRYPSREVTTIEPMMPTMDVAARRM
jgi:hypothetical protein